MSAAPEAFPTAPDEGEHESDTCSTIVDMSDASSDSGQGREPLNEDVQRPRTNLLSLPPELHHKIFKHLRTCTAGKRPICRALWPMARRNLFRAVRIWTPERLQRFASLVRPMHRTYRSPGLLRELWQSGRLIKVLDIKVQPPRRRWRTPPDASDSDDSTAEGSVTPDVMPDIADSTASSQIRAVLTQATRVRRLTMSGPRALEYLLPAKSGFAWLRELEQLTLKIFGGSVQLWSAEGLSRLRRFPRLKELYLDLSDHFAPPPTASQTTLLPVPQLHQFHLSLESSAVPTELARCVTLFTDIKKLVVDINVVEDFDEAATEHDFVGLGGLLQAVPASRLSTLVISCPYDKDMFPDELPGPGLTIEADLARFNCLTHLSLCHNTFHRAGELFGLLVKHVPQLQYLTLGRYAYVRAAKLLSFVRQKGGPGRALEEVQCDIYFGAIDSSRVPSEMQEDSSVMDGTFELAEWWDLPLWQSDFTVAQAGELVTAGQEVGVRITGDLPEAIRTETARVREQAFLDERRDEFLYHDLSSLFGSE